MIPALFLVAAMADWVPIRWISSEPKSLDLLRGAAMNCLLVESPQLNAAFTQRAHEQGLAVVAVVRPNQKATPIPVDAIALEGDFEASISPPGIPVIELPSRQHIRLDTRAPIAGTWQGLWPGIIIEHGGKVMAGPSSNPWIDTNTGFLRFLRAAMDSALWVAASPPAHTVIPPERYGIAIADAAAAGARWIVTLDADLQRRLLEGDGKALEDWRRIAGYVAYFERHPEWREFRPFSRMALLQDRDSGGLLSAGLLDLMYAQHIAARAAPLNRVNASNLEGVGLLIDIAGPDRFSAGQRRTLASFAKSGGVLLQPPPEWRLGEDAPGSTTPTKSQLNRIQEIWEMLYNATARKNFGARTFNTAGILFNVLASPQEKKLLIHLVNYTQFPGDTITVHALGTWKRARLYTPGGPVQDLAVYPVKDGTGVDLEKLDVAASLLLE